MASSYGDMPEAREFKLAELNELPEYQLKIHDISDTLVYSIKRSGAILPPMVAFDKDLNKIVIIDGNKRIAVCRLLRKETLRCLFMGRLDHKQILATKEMHEKTTRSFTHAQTGYLINTMIQHMAKEEGFAFGKNKKKTKTFVRRCLEEIAKDTLGSFEEIQFCYIAYCLSDKYKDGKPLSGDL